MTNQELMRKADFEVGDLAADGGLLNPEQADAFIRKLLEQPTLLRQVRVVRMNSPQRNINKIQFNKRILRPGTSGSSLDTPAVDSATPFDPLAENTARAKPQTDQVVLTTKEVIAEVRLPYDVIEDNIERGNIGLHQDVGGTPAQGGIRDTIMTLIAERVALDLEELAINGDTAVVAADPYLGLLDGYLKLSTANVVAGVGAISKTMFKDGLIAMPDQYLRNLAAMRHFVATDKEIEYRDTLASRETNLGDGQIQGTSPVFGFGVPVERVSLMPAAQGLTTNPLNLIWGIQRQIHMETDKDIRKREYIIVVTARIDFQVEEIEAAVKYTGIT